MHVRISFGNMEVTRCFIKREGRKVSGLHFLIRTLRRSVSDSVRTNDRSSVSGCPRMESSLLLVFSEGRPSSVELTLIHYCTRLVGRAGIKCQHYERLQLLEHRLDGVVGDVEFEES